MGPRFSGPTERLFELLSRALPVWARWTRNGAVAARAADCATAVCSAARSRPTTTTLPDGRQASSRRSIGVASELGLRFPTMPRLESLGSEGRLPPDSLVYTRRRSSHT